MRDPGGKRGTAPITRERVAIDADISDLVSRYGLAAAAESKLRALLNLVAADPHAPTAVRSPKAILDDHLADSLSALELPKVTDARQIVDIGAGAGFPGLALAVALPSARVILLEAEARKCDFIARAAAAAGIDNAEAVHARAEAWPDGAGRFDLATARALAPLAVVAEYAAPLLQVGGFLVAWRGKRDPRDEDATAHAAAELGLAVCEPIRVRPYAESVDRHLHVLEKVDRTPDRFPRRPGVARKRPLGAARPKYRATSDREQR